MLHGGLSQGEPGVRKTKRSEAELWLPLGQQLGGPKPWPLQGATIYGLMSPEKPPLMWLQTPLKGAGTAAQDGPGEPRPRLALPSPPRQPHPGLALTSPENPLPGWPSPSQRAPSQAGPPLSIPFCFLCPADWEGGRELSSEKEGQPRTCSAPS